MKTLSEFCGEAGVSLRGIRFLCEVCWGTVSPDEVSCERTLRFGRNVALSGLLCCGNCGCRSDLALRIHEGTFLVRSLGRWKELRPETARMPYLLERIMEVCGRVCR